MGERSRPRLVIVAGPPAAGKSTSAPPLALALSIPWFSIDAIKERLADAIGLDALPYADALGDAALRQMIAIAGELLASGQDVMIEGYIPHGSSEGVLQPLVAMADAVVLHLHADDLTLKHRYETRAIHPNRHWIHGDLAKLGTLLPELPAEMAAPLELGVSRIFVDTTAGRARLEAVAALVARALDDPLPQDYHPDVTTPT